jgi:O-antigen ligase
MLLMPPQFERLALELAIVLSVALILIDRPAIIFYALIIILFSNLDIYAPFRLYRFIVILTIASFALMAATGRRIVSHHPILVALIAAFMIVAFQSLSVAREYGMGMRKFSQVFKWLVVMWVAAQFVRDRKEFRRLLLVLAAGILMADLLPFVLHPPARFASHSLLWSRGVVRYEGFVFEPNTFAMFQIFLIPVLIFFIGSYPRPRLARPLLLAAILASVFVLILSFSRGGFVGFVCLLATLIIIERRNKPVFFFGIAVIAAGMVILPGVYWDRVKSVLEFASRGGGDSAISTRLDTMKIAIKLGLANPLLGVGIDNFMVRAGHFIPYGLTVHNTPLQIFSELGIVALAVFVGIVAYNFTIIRRLMGRRDDSEAVRIGRALFIQQTAMLATILFLPGAYEMVFWFMVVLPAMAGYAYRREAPAVSDAEGVPTGRK